MACRDAYRIKSIITKTDRFNDAITSQLLERKNKRLLFGADSRFCADNMLQNNISEFEWVVRNKIYPNFYGRYINGENCLTKEEIDFIHRKGCKIAVIYSDNGIKHTGEQGMSIAEKAIIQAKRLCVSKGTTIFLEIGENDITSRDFMREYAKLLISAGYTPGFKANTDARYGFDREFSRGVQTDRDVFEQCLIWAVSPTIREYNNITTSHLIHPDNWLPYTPSAIRRSEIAIWQYGVNCHPIEDENGKIITFNLDLVCNEQVIIKKMF